MWDRKDWRVYFRHKKRPRIARGHFCILDGSPAENRTPVSALKGLCPNRWTTRPYVVSKLPVDTTLF